MQSTYSFDDLSGKSVFITGGGAGIGEFITRGFLEQGANVTFVQRTDASAFCDELERETGRRPTFIACDVADPDSLLGAISMARKTYGPIEVLVNNAANDSRHELRDLTADEWDHSLNVNLRPHFLTSQAVEKDMRTAGSGSIINFSSISYLLGNSGYPAYVAAKAAITGLTRALARELGPYNIRVNALLPGWVMTKRQRELWVTENALSEHLKKQCLNEALLPEHIVAPTLFLASNASQMITSQAVIVDGGCVVTG